MKILLVFEYSSLNGGENSLLAVIDLLRTRAEWCAIAPRGPISETLDQLQIAQDELPCFSGQSRLPQTREYLESRIRELKPTIVHANSLAMSRIAAPVCQSLETPMIGHLRDIIGLSAKAMSDLNVATQLVAVSKAVRDYHVERGLAPDRVTIIPNGIDLVKFRPAAPTGYLHRELGLSESSVLIGGIGQLGIRKGWDTLMAAMVRLCRNNKDVQFVLVGERHSMKAESEEYEQRLIQVASDPPLAGRVHFLGRRTDVERILPEITMLVHPARQEPLGRVLLEAAACGLPVVATHVGGTPEIFPGSADAAIMVPPDDPVALEEAISCILVDDARRQQLGSHARCEIESRFAASSCAEATWGLYERIVAQQRRHS